MADHCKSCGAEIMWGVTLRNKRIPMDAKFERRFVFIDSTDDVRLVSTFQSHFATCPNAAEHRKNDDQS